MECEICKKPIMKQDNYVRLTDYLKGEFYAENFYHNKCYTNKIKEAITLNKKVLVEKLKGFIIKGKEIIYGNQMQEMPV